MDINGFVGQVNQQDGTKPQIRAGRQGDMIVSELQGRYFEQTVRGNSYSLNLIATTTGVAAGNINAAAAAVSTQFALWNPPSSKVNLVITKVFAGLISGTPPGGPMFHNLMLQGVPTIASVGVAQNNFAGGQQPQARFVTSAAGTALTGGGALTVLRPMQMDFFAAALAAGANINGAMEETAGDIILPPGTGWVPCFSAAGTTLLNSFGVVWNEVPQ